MSEKKNNNNNMRTIKYLIDYFELEYCIVVIGINSTTGKKEVVGRNHNIKNIQDSKINNLIYGINQKDISTYYICYEIKLKDEPIVIIDFDDENITLEEIYKLYPNLKDCYYTIGNNKGFHFWTFNDDTKGMSSHNKVLNYTEGDFIKEQVWEQVDKILYGEETLKVEDYTIYFKKYPFEKVNQGTNNIIKSLDTYTTPLQTKIENLDELKEIVNNIQKKYSDNYDDWIKIISILKKYDQYELALNFSKKSIKFISVEDFEDWYYNRTINCDRLTIATIFDYSKNNKTEFNKIKTKYRKLEDKKKKLEMLEEIENNNSAEYEIIKEEFELTHFFVVNNIGYIKLCEETDTKKTMFLSKTQILDMYLWKQFIGYDDKGNLKNISVVSKWIKDPNILKYNNCDYYPNPTLCPSNSYNLWTGFVVENYSEDICSEEDLKIILNHIKLICGGDTAVYEYILDWFAHIFLYPEQKIGIFPIFQGTTGTGKSMILNMIKYMIGKDKCGFTNNAKDEVFGAFNPKMSGKIFMELAELDFLATKGLENKFKSLITDEIVNINDKQEKSYDQISYHRFIASTNEDIPIKITNDDRRILLIECSDTMKSVEGYFEKLFELVNSKKVQKRFYNFLINRDTVFTSPAEALKRRPTTAVQQELMEYFTPPEQLYFKELVNELYCENRKYISVSAEQVYIKYKKFCEDTGIKEPMTKTKLGFKLKKIYKDAITKKKSVILYYVIDTTKKEIKDLLDNTNILEDSDSD